MTLYRILRKRIRKKGFINIQPLCHFDVWRCVMIQDQSAAKGLVTRSRGPDLNKLVSEQVVMGDFRSFQQQFETFLKMYEENRDRDRQERDQDRALMAAQQQALARRLDELSRELSTGRPEGRAEGGEGSIVHKD
ncbi:protein phosphatase CheZ [Striga asiatica]|uniref:Protein phosphatase CheZ n=1 Tax=Striga asiatica TaxID=4170 RepID=A0A5A7QB19_STRAF|nr:protein phosphatase CheZ [Striga asiatica]